MKHMLKYLFLSLAFALVSSMLLPHTSKAYATEWASSVVSSSQAKQKDGNAVASTRSDPSKALGVAEQSDAEGTFYSLGFGGSIVLGFDQPFANGVATFESTNIPYATESARVEFSADGVNWVTAGSVNNLNSPNAQTVSQPENLSCAKYVRITDSTDPAAFEPTADGYDVDGVRADGEACVLPTPMVTPEVTPAPTSPPSNNDNNNNNNNSNNNSNNSQPTPCTDTKPGTPSITNVNRTSGTTIQLTWTSVSPANSYSISYGTSPGNYQFGVPSTGNVTTFSIGGLASGTNYYFSVRAINGCMPGDPSGEHGIGGGGNVLGATTDGQVLGASTDTLAATGHMDQVYAILAGLGVAVSSFGTVVWASKR